MKAEAIGVTERGDAALSIGSCLNWLAEGKPAILMTKNIVKLAPYLHPFQRVVVHCTITGWGGTALEPGVPPPEETLKAYHKLYDKLPSEAIVLRIDPIVPTPRGIERAKKVWQQREPGGRVRISFLDTYPYLLENLKKARITLPYSSFHAPFSLRQSLWQELDCPEICGEPGFECAGCVSYRDCQVLGVVAKTSYSSQRYTCHCLANKKELLAQRCVCEHGCLYCYWRNPQYNKTKE